MADEQQMIDLLGVERGCATPMALMNDKDKSGNASKVSKPGLCDDDDIKIETLFDA